MLLDACPACRRPYDVSSLAPGTEIRCQCQRVFAIRHRARHLEVRWCRRCGGPVGAEERACGYCEGAFTEDGRGRRLCPSCLASAPSDARHCPGCGASLAPRTLEPLEASAACPRCDGALRLSDLGPARAAECTACGGAWLSSGGYLALAREAGRRMEPPEPGRAGPAEPSGPAPLAEPGRVYVRCLGCGEPMLRRRLCSSRGPAGHGVVVDVCAPHGLWLDRDELEQAMRLQRQLGSGELVGASLFRSEASPAAGSACFAGLEREPAAPLRRALELVVGLLGLRLL